MSERSGAQYRVTAGRQYDPRANHQVTHSSAFHAANGDEDAQNVLVGDTDNDDVRGCPQCGGPGTSLGRLGRVDHMRCRNCGWDFTA